MGRGGGQVVSMLSFYSDDPSSIPAEAYSFLCKICVWKITKIKKELTQFLKKAWKQTAKTHVKRHSTTEWRISVTFEREVVD